MQNESIGKQRYRSKVSTKNLLKIVIFLDLIFSLYLLLYFITYHQIDLLEYLPFYFYVIFLFFWGLLLVTIAGVSYIARMSKLSQIPSSSSVYDAITLPTIQYGTVKIIFPSDEEEPLEENVI
ncbi:MAG: hypothetical protein ACFFFH_08055 [Candidatus Thorarchaeota archaeon]